MNYLETLKFISLCLSLRFEDKNKPLVREKLKTISWENIIKISDAHYVFPNLYIQLKNADLLDLVPEDLVEYMQFLTKKNRARNNAILNQIEHLTRLLNQENIVPIFTKGTSYILENLYLDIGERIIGDIDFLLPKNQIEKAAEILFENGYYEFYDKEKGMGFHPENHRHLPRLVHKEEIAAIEIHKEMLVEKYASYFNYETVKNSLQEINFRGTKLYVLSKENQLILNACSLQLNDFGYKYGKIILRNLYDLIILSDRIDSLKIIETYPDISKYLNSYLAISKTIFPTISTIKYKKNRASEFYKFRSLVFLKYRKLTVFRNYLEVIVKLIYNSYLHLICPNLRAQFRKKINSKEWKRKKIKYLKKMLFKI